MTIRPVARTRRAHLRRISAVLVVATGLSVTGGAFTPSIPARAAPAPATVTLSQVVGLQYGSSGEAVRELQRALVRVGVGVVHGVDGYFGSATRASVKAWQGHKGLRVSGVVDVSTGRSLGFADPAAAAPATGGSSSTTPVYGSRGASVARLQLALINRGFVPTGGVDGLFGNATLNVLKRFQQAKGLAVTGKADAATMSALGLSGSAPAASGGTTPTDGVLARGATGAQVVRLQQALMKSGIAVVGGADGVFGAGTEAAVKRFQANKGLPQTGQADTATSTALGLTGGAPAPQTPAAPTGASRYVGLKLGSSGAAVAELQRALMKLGWTVRGGADGYFGAATQSVLIIFQRTNGTPATGVVDAATAQVLGLSGASPTTPTPPAGSGGGATAAGFAQYDERGARVVALQRALMAKGIAVPGGADGVFGSATAGAVMNFQRAVGLPATGRVDATTAQRLGLAAAPAATQAPPPAVRLEAKPVEGPCYYGDTYGFTRGGGRAHLGVDILAATGNDLYAVATGKITQIYVDRPGSLSGNGLKITRADGTYFFYAHLSQLAPGIAVGSPVRAGQLVGFVGTTGNSATPHLHLEIHPGGGAAVNPYPIVKATGAC